MAVDSNVDTLLYADQVDQQVWPMSWSALPTMPLKNDKGLHPDVLPLLPTDTGGPAGQHLLWEPAAALHGSQGCLAAESLSAGRLQAAGEAAQEAPLAAEPCPKAAPPDLPAAVPEGVLVCKHSVLRAVHHVPVSSLTCHRSLAI